MSFAVKDEMEKLLRTGYYRSGYMLEDDGIMILNREHKTLLNVWSDAKNGMEIDKDIKNSFARPFQQFPAFWNVARFTTEMR